MSLNLPCAQHEMQALTGEADCRKSRSHGIRQTRSGLHECRQAALSLWRQGSVCSLPQAGARLRAQAKVYALQRVVLPVSGLASWLLVAAGGLMTLHVLGINIAPLLTVGGVSGIIVGLSAQSVMSNMISGINLVRSQLHSVRGCHGFLQWQLLVPEQTSSPSL